MPSRVRDGLDDRKPLRDGGRPLAERPAPARVLFLTLSASKGAPHPPEMTVVAEMTPTELKARRDAGTGPRVLDVREGWELDVARIPDVVHIPMNEIPGRLIELPRGEGGAGRHVSVRWAEHAGRAIPGPQRFHPGRESYGGILAWSREVDPSVKPY